MTLEARLIALAQAVGADIKALQPASGGAPAWLQYTLMWSTPPSKLGTASSPVAGDVYSYTLGGVTRYRLVPATYTAGNDKFYTAFSAGACTGPIAGAARNGT